MPTITPETMHFLVRRVVLTGASAKRIPADPERNLAWKKASQVFLDRTGRRHPSSHPSIQK